jgi:formylglycine-generating enzyme required for sulfatase activity
MGARTIQVTEWRWVGTNGKVGSFPPNAFGLYDTHGNVMQWVEDCFSNFYAGAPTDGSAFQANVPVTGMTSYLSYMNGTNSCLYRIIRGGCWGDTPNLIRSSSRNLAPAPEQTLETYRSTGLGIRVVRALD